jgi:hypothetical protein
VELLHSCLLLWLLLPNGVTFPRAAFPRLPSAEA